MFDQKPFVELEAFKCLTEASKTKKIRIQSYDFYILKMDECFKYKENISPTINISFVVAVSLNSADAFFY